MSELNKWLMTDIEDIPEAEISNFEKKQMKKRLLGRKSTSSWLTKLVVAASIFIGLSTTAVIAFPSFASQLPILQNIVSYFDEEQLIFNHFSEVAQPLGLTETSNGSTVTIEEAIYDGTSVTISFALQTETDLGDFPVADGILEAAGAGGSGSAIAMEKVNGTTYAGMITMTPDFFFQPPTVLKVSWEPGTFEDVPSGTKITGDWSFSFKLQAIDSKHVAVGQAIEFQGGTYTLNELLLTKLSTVLTLNKEHIDEEHYLTTWLLEDNLGNTYPMQFGTGNTTQQQFTFEALNPEAASVTIKPIITYAEHVDDVGTEVEVPSVTIDLE